MASIVEAGPEILGRCPAMGELRERIDRVLGGRQATRRLPPVLIRGETGTGKSLLARLLHLRGPRADGPFVDVNCAAIPATLLEAEMFGYERGAFTDASQAKPGLFQVAHRGALFLDEVALLPETLQGKLLKVIEEQSVRRLGSTRSEPVDVWVVAATSSRDPTAGLREDLFHRLAVVGLWLPPLRERGEDVRLLAEHFLARACAEYGLAPKSLTAAATTALVRHRWPGNVRELANVMERSALLAAADELEPAMLGLGAGPEPGSRPFATLEPDALLAALQETGWNVSRAAEQLGLSRNMLRYRMRKHGLERRDRVARPAPAGPASSAPEAPVAAAVRWERRALTVLAVSVDRAGAAPELSDSARLIEAALEKVRSFGGAPEEVATGRVVAAFGLDAGEDAPLRAALAATAIQKAVERSRADQAGALTIRSAIHGDQFVTARLGDQTRIDTDGKREASGVLDELLARAHPGDILVSAAIVPRLERRFDLTPVGEAEGRAWRLAGPDRPGFAIRGRASPFVARQQDLELLRSRLASARRGQGQVVAIVGEPGIGKSRLLHEFGGAIAAEPVLYAEGRCLSYATASAYLPLIDIIRALVGLAEGEAPEVAGERVRAFLRAVGMEPSAAPVFLGLLGLPEGAVDLPGVDRGAVRMRIFATIQEALLRQSRLTPLAVAVEDLQWIDETSGEFLTSFVEHVAAAPILLLVTHRPEYSARWAARSFVSQVGLAPLSPDDSLAVVRSVLGSPDVPGDLAALVVARAEGNPLFIEELTRAVADTGQAAPAPGLPVTLHDVLLARLDRLGADDRHVLQFAAVIGRDVAWPLLRALVAAPDGAVRASLARLQAAEFLLPSALAPEPHWSFKHALTHEAAYESLPGPERLRAHAQVVEAIERLHAGRLGEHLEALAHHAFHGEVWDKAVRYLEQAGTRAFARSALREAKAHFERALEALERLPRTRDVVERGLDLRFSLRHALFTLGEYGQIFDRMREVERLAEEVGDERRLAEASYYLATGFYAVADHVAADRHARRGLARAAALGDRMFEVEAAIRLGLVHHGLGDYETAVDFLRPTLDHLVVGHHLPLTPVSPFVHARVWLAWCCADLGRFEEGRIVGEDALRMAETPEHPNNFTMATFGLGHLLLVQGDLERAIGVLERGVDVARRTGNAHWFPRVAAALGYGHTLAGRVADGLGLLEEAIARARANGLRAMMPRFVGWWAETLHLRGRGDEATSAAHRALEMAREQGERGNEAHALRTLGALAGADLQGAAAHFTEALQLSRALGMCPLEARCRLELGLTLSALGESAAAGEHLAAAAEQLRSLRMARWVPEAERALAAP
jgi:transcriptional regulator with AAA-type ATPase domain/tetratricopeptide (TPR) repeat protein